MKKFAYSVLIIGISLIFMAMSFHPVSEVKNKSEIKEITIHNETDMDIKKLFFSKEGEEDWKEISFDFEKFNDTRKVTVKFSVEADCYYDIKVINTEDKFYIWETFDFCNEKEVFLYIEEESDEPDTSNVDLNKQKF